MTCYRQLQQKIDGIQTEKDCLDVARAIYEFIDSYPERTKALQGKVVVFRVPKSFEAGEKTP